MKTNKNIYLVLFTVILCSCRVFNEEYKNKDYFKLKGGKLSFVSSIPVDSLVINNNDNCNSGDTCFLFRIIDSFDSLEKDKDLGVLLQLKAKYFSRKWSGAVPDGSIEKITGMTFYLKKGKEKFIIDKYNEENSARITCSDYFDRKGKFLIPTTEQKWHAIEGKSVFPHHQIPILRINSFINHFNNKSSTMDLIEEYQFHFNFNKTLFNDLKFQPNELIVEIHLKTQKQRKARKLTIKRDAHVSDILR